jgi:hypothetical protein
MTAGAAFSVYVSVPDVAEMTGGRLYGAMEMVKGF